MEFKGQLLELIGEGSRRACYRLGDTGHCVKFYRPPEECRMPGMRSSVVQEIRRRRFNRKKNVCAQEFDVWKRMVKRLPNEIRALLPETMELVYHPDWGWGSEQPFLTNPDGAGIVPAELEMWRHHDDSAFVSDMYRRVRDSLRAIVRSGLPLYEASNLFVQWQSDGTPALKVIDFEPVVKTFIPIERLFPWARRWVMRHKCKKYLAYLRKVFQVGEGESI